jgi:hypothetical protein
MSQKVVLRRRDGSITAFSVELRRYKREVKCSSVMTANHEGPRGAEFIG